MTELAELSTPALLLDLDKLESNLQAMAARSRALGVALRPHIKSHKCIEIGRMQQSLGAKGITVSTLEEAHVFAANGFDDITWAFPVISSRIDEARRLSERVALRLVVDSREALDWLQRTGHPFNVWIKVDCGYHRAGVDPASELALRLARDLSESPTLRFDGILTHSGHSYQARGRDALKQVAEDERRVMVEFSNRLKRDAAIDVWNISVGSTPAMSCVEHLHGVTEARPGNYALYDHNQTVIGSCTVPDCAVTVLSSVVSSQPAWGHCVIDAGALALSKDAGPADAQPPTMGEIFDDYGSGALQRAFRVTSVSQEHGTVNHPLSVGSKVRILPNHACLAVAQFDYFYAVRGHDILDRWRIWRRR